MKKICCYILFVLIVCLSFVGISQAKIANGTGSLDAGGGVSPCNTGFCYSTNFDDSGYAHIGIRFSLVWNNGEPVDGLKSVDLLTSTLQSQIDQLKNINFATFDFKSSKKTISSQGVYIYDHVTEGGTIKGVKATNWDAFSLVKSLGPDIVTKTGEQLLNGKSKYSGYLENLKDIEVSASNSHSGLDIYNHFFGGDNGGYLINNYNTNNDNGHSVFSTYGGTDHNAVNDILKEISTNLVADELEKNGYMIQIEPITIIRASITNNGRKNVFYIYGTTSEIRAIVSQYAATVYGMDKGYNVAVLFNDDDYTYREENGKLAGNSALSYLNTGMVAKMKLGDTYGGYDVNSGKNLCSGDKYGTQHNWNLAEYHNCGIGIITGFGEGHYCEVLEGDVSKDEPPLLYYGSQGTLLNNQDEKPGEAFINECVCDPFSKDKKTKEDVYDKYFSLFAQETNYNIAEYYKTWCLTSEDKNPNAGVCTPQIINEKCTGNVSISDDKDCVFKNNINKYLYTSEKADVAYTNYANNYCNISCAEDINFTFPKDFSNIAAGTYFEIPTTSLKVNGTRTCQATYDWDNFNNKVTNSSNISDVIKSIYAGEGKFNDNSFSNYSLKQINQALKTLYDRYKILNQTLGNNDSWQSTDPNEPVYTYKEWKFTIDFDNSADTEDENYGAYECYKGSNRFDCTSSEFQNKFSSISFNNLNTPPAEEGQWYTLYNTKNITLNSTKNGITIDSILTKIKNKISENATKIEKELEQIDKCATSFNSTKETYDFNPNINFSYDEGYKWFFYEKPFIKISNETTQPLTLNPSNNYYEESISYYTNESTLDSKNYQAVRGNTNVTSTISKEITYSSPVDFYSSTPSGIILEKNGSNYLDVDRKVHNSSVISLDKNIYPVALTANNKNDNNYQFNFSDLGDYSIVTKDSGVGRMDSRNFKALTDNTINQLTYYCTYEVKKDVTTDKVKNSDATDDDIPNFFYRNISLNAFNPNNRDLGKNWTGPKAQATLCELNGGRYENGNCIENQSLPEDIYNEPEYSFHLTPENMQNIRKYNKIKEENGDGYGDFDMKEYQFNNEEKSLGHWYTSNFLRDKNICPNCFTANTLKDSSDLFQKWKDNNGKLSELGPAWK